MIMRIGSYVGKMVSRLAAIVVFGLNCSNFAIAESEGNEILPPERADEHIGEFRSVCGRVRSASHVRNMKGRPTFLHFGKSWPDHSFSVVVWGRVRKDLEFKPERLAGSDVCATGTIHRYQMKPQIEINHAGQLVKVAIED